MLKIHNENVGCFHILYNIIITFVTMDDPDYYLWWALLLLRAMWGNMLVSYSRCWTARPEGETRPRQTCQPTFSFSFRLSFVFCNEFVEFLCVTARGSPRQRSDLVFRLCDLERTGAVSFKHLATVLKSVSQLGKATIALHWVNYDLVKSYKNLS